MLIVFLAAPEYFRNFFGPPAKAHSVTSAYETEKSSPLSRRNPAPSTLNDPIIYVALYSFQHLDR